MDQDLHLERQLEELTAQLNMPSDSDVVSSPTSPSTAIPKESESEFLADSLENFTVPTFSTAIPLKTPNIDVTNSLSEPPTVAPKTDVETNIDALLAGTHEVAQEQTENLEDFIQPGVESAISGPSRLDMGAMRLDVAKISADIQSGEEIYRRALQRVEGLMNFVEKAEVDFSVLNRLEPENRRLKARLRTSQGEVETIKGQLMLTTADLEDHRKRLEDKTKEFDQAHSNLLTAASSLKEYERVLKDTKTGAEKLALTVERHKTALNVEGRENKVLREKISELSKSLEARQSEYLEASKMVESLRTDCDDFRGQAETYRSEAQDLRVTLNTAKSQNNAMKSEMRVLHEDIKTFKTQYEFNAISREDRVIDLESQIQFLAKEIDAKTEVANTVTEDLAALRTIRTQQDIERDRLEKQLLAAKEEIKDINALSETRYAEKQKNLQNTIEGLQTEISTLDGVSQQKSKEINDVQRANKKLKNERDELLSRLEKQTEKLEDAIRNNPENELRARIKDLTEQLRVKDVVVQSAAQDVSTLQKTTEAQILENKKLEELINTQKFQLEAAQNALYKSKQIETELDKKYKDIAAALSVNQERRRSESSSENPDIAPDISDEFEELTGDDVEDRIMDYKFGIRKDIL